MAELFMAHTVAQARELLAAHINFNYVKETVPIQEALGLRLAREVRAVDDVPGFDRSTMDGFAVRARETFGASESLPAYLDVSGEVFMGKAAPDQLGPGQVWRIPTGGMLPPGADAVVMVEHTEELDDVTIGVNKPVAPGENIVRRGEDIAAGSPVLGQGHLIRPQDMGLLGAVGVLEVEVLSPLRVAVISTGDEVVDPSENPGPGQVRDINSYALYGMAAAAGARAKIYGIVKDDLGLLRDTLGRALEENDIVLLSGGSSVGTRDVSEGAVRALGQPGVLFHGISIKPGKPTIGAVVGGKPVFGLPGHPVSAMVVFLLLVEPLIKRGRYPATDKEVMLDFPVLAKMVRNIRSAAGREDFVRVTLSPGGAFLAADPVLGKSGLIATMVKADGLAWVPSEKEGVEAGELVWVKLF